MEYERHVLVAKSSRYSLTRARRARRFADDLPSLGVVGAPDDPCSACPACCGTFFKKPGYVGPADALLPTLTSVSGDACFKGHVLVSNKVDTRPSVLTDFIGTIQAEVMAENIDSAKPVEKDVPQDHCDAVLRCAKAEAPQSKLYTYKAVMGLACHHVFPLRKCFVFTPRGGK